MVNYPNEHLYTRVTEFKYLTGQEHPKTSIVYEYPQAEGDPYYPVPRPENAEIYKQYKQLADLTPNVHFVGRLATYKYYNMDQVVAQALMIYKNLCHRPISQPEDEVVTGKAIAGDRTTDAAVGNLPRSTPSPSKMANNGSKTQSN